MRYADPYDDGPIYLDGTKMTEQICLRMRIGGQEGWYPIVAWGTHWYEADGQWEVILEDTSEAYWGTKIQCITRGEHGY